MLDPQYIRDNLDAVKADCKNRNVNADIDRVVALDDGLISAAVWGIASTTALDFRYDLVGGPIMTMHVKAIFENGLFRPLQPVQLEEKQEVTVVIEDECRIGVDDAHFVLPPNLWQTFCDALDAPPRDIPALRKLLTEASVLDGTADSAADPGSA